MAQPPAYTRGTDFSDYAGNNPGDPMSGTSLDAEFDDIKTTIDAILTNLALVQRDDTGLANDTVGADQVKSDLVLGINPAGAWLTATAYAVNDGVWQSYKLYVCQTAHTSGTFATDLTAVKWLEVVDVGAVVDAAVAADAELVTVAGIETEVIAVAAIAAAVSTVAGIDTETAAVAAIAAEVATVAGDSADIQTVAANIATIAAKMSADFSNASGTLPIDHGGTGATTAAAARTGMGLGTAAVVDTGTGDAEVPLGANVGQAPARTDYTSGSGTYTTPAGTKYLKVTMVGGGASGGGSNANGTDGADTTFGTVTAKGGVKGTTGNTFGGLGGTGGTGTLGTTTRYPGGRGDGVHGSTTNLPGGRGGGTKFGDGGGAPAGAGNAGSPGATNSGGGGSGASVSGGTPGSGAGGGETVEMIIPTPAASYAYSVAATAAGAGSAPVGGVGAAGRIIVEAYS